MSLDNKILCACQIWRGSERSMKYNLHLKHFNSFNTWQAKSWISNPGIFNNWQAKSWVSKNFHFQCLTAQILNFQFWQLELNLNLNFQQYAGQILNFQSIGEWSFKNHGSYKVFIKFHGSHSLIFSGYFLHVVLTFSVSLLAILRKFRSTEILYLCFKWYLNVLQSDCLGLSIEVV